MPTSATAEEHPTRPASYFAMPVDEVVEAFTTDPKQGLSNDEAARRLEQHGPNSISEHTTPGALQRFAAQLNQPLIYILLVAAAVTAGLQEWIDTAVIVAVVVVNAVVGFIQESRAVKALDALARSMSSEATVLRGGDEHRIDARKLVPGDVVLVTAGQKVPADLRLVRTRELRTDESALTGEPIPIEKYTDPVEDEAVLGDRFSMAFASTVVSFGQATGVVVATADDTEVGKVSELVAGVDELQTPLTRKISQFSSILLVVIVVLGALTFAIGMLRGMELAESFMASVALIVAAIPEGLPAAMTIVLATGVNRMAARRAIIRKLPAVETLGSTTVICSDKTGTLTENQMTVTAVVAGAHRYELTGTGYDPDGDVLEASAGEGDSDASDEVLEASADEGEAGPADDGEPAGDGGIEGSDGAEDSGRGDANLSNVALRETLRCGLLCNEAHLIEEGDDGDWDVVGDPTEGALVVAAHKAGLHTESEQDECPRIDEVPFSSQHQYMATLHETSDVDGQAGERICYLKGSVERVLERSDSAMQPDGSTGEVDRDALLETADRLAGEGLRVLAFASRTFDSSTNGLDHDHVAEGLTFLGLQGMIDPPRPAAIEAVQACHEAGIDVKMITGDHPATARAIAAQLGITSEDDPGEAMTGAELADVDVADLQDATRHIEVFARVSPEQKLRLVEGLQRDGAVVAMTGDGVNDAPALKQADIGVAMGLKGSDAAKDASDMVLTDDNFASIRAAVEEGRGVFDNLLKFIAWTLPVNLGQALIVIVAVLVGGDLPVTPVQILWINMSTALLLGLMLAFEPKEPGIMDRPPREHSVPILDPQIITRILLVGGLLVAGAFGLFTLERAQGATLDQARTVAVNTYVVVQIAYLFNGRSLSRRPSEIGWFTNPWIWVGSAAMLSAQLAMAYVPVVQAVFGTAAIGIESWLRIVAVAVVAYAAVSVERRLRHR